MFEFAIISTNNIQDMDTGTELETKLILKWTDRQGNGYRHGQFTWTTFLDNLQNYKSIEGVMF
jgi:hypothetical protein